MLKGNTAIYREMIKNEVFPALGCTEPTAVAYAASLAAAELHSPAEHVRIVVDPGVFKNGFAVTVPNTGGEKGNCIAGALGALIARPNLKMEILKGATEKLLSESKRMVAEKRASVTFDPSKTDMYIDVTVETGHENVRAVLSGGHTNLVTLEKDGHALFHAKLPASGRNYSYRDKLRKMSFKDFIMIADELAPKDLAFIGRGVEMNLAIVETGKSQRKVGYFVSELVDKGFLVDDVISSTKIMTAAASDARMAGLPYPVMSSGGSGNQGIVAILVPYNVGKSMKIRDGTILRSIALSHLVNGYIKCFSGDLSPICGCAIAAGVGAAVAIVYQQAGNDMGKITLAVNTLISDLGGMLCDGAKGGCALKVVSSTDSAIRSAYMALNGHGISEEEGFVGGTAEDTIRNLCKITEKGMSLVDETMLGIMLEKRRLSLLSKKY